MFREDQHEHGGSDPSWLELQVTPGRRLPLRADSFFFLCVQYDSRRVARDPLGAFVDTLRDVGYILRARFVFKVSEHAEGERRGPVSI